MRQGLGRFVRDTAWAFSSLAVASGIHFILRAFLARYYGAADLGLYTLAFTAYAVGLNFSGFGIGSGLVKYVAEYERDSQRTGSMLASGIAISFLSGCFLGLLAYLVSPYVAYHFFKMPELATMFRIVSVAFPFIAVEKAALGYLNAKRQMHLFALVNVVQNALVVCLTLAFAFSGHDITYAVLGLLLPLILMSVVSLLLVGKSISWGEMARFGFGSSLPVTKMLVSFGFYVVLSAAVTTVQTYTATTLLGYFRTDTDVGLFGVVQSVMPILTLPSDAIQAITTPMIASYWGKQEITNIESLVNRSMRLAAVYAVIAAFVLGMLGKQILGLLFGPSFSSAAVPLQIMLFSGVLGAILGSIGGALSSTKYVRLVFRISGASLVLNVILNVVLIPRFGLAGAAIATSFSMCIYALAHLYFIQRLIKIRIERPWFVKLVCFALVVAVPAYLAGNVTNAYVGTLAGFLLLVVVVMTIFVSRDERTQVLNLFLRK